MVDVVFKFPSSVIALPCRIANPRLTRPGPRRRILSRILVEAAQLSPHALLHEKGDEHLNPRIAEALELGLVGVHHLDLNSQGRPHSASPSQGSRYGRLDRGQRQDASSAPVQGTNFD